MITNRIFKRKGLAVLLGILLIFSAGCQQHAQKRFIVWSQLRPVERAKLQEKLNEFGRRYPRYQFKELFYETEQLRTNYIIAALAGKGPQVVHCPSDNVGPFSDLKVVRPLEDLFSQAFLDSFLTDPFPANTWFHGHLYQIADRIGNHLCLVYNKKYLQTPPKTMSELIAWGRKFARDEDGDGWPERYALVWNYIEPYFVIPFIGGFGGWIVDEKGNPTLDTPAVVQAAQFIYDLAHKERIIPREADYETANALFKDGRAAMIINGPWSWSTYTEAGIDIGLARIPRIDQTGLWPTPMVSPLGYMINVNLKGEELRIAVELVRFLTSDKVELEFARAFNLIPSRKVALQDSVLRSSELWRASYDQLLVGRPMPVFTELRWIWDAMRPAYQGIFSGRYTPAEAARKMQALAEKLIRENR
ncbi:MAG: extracellular solute-binding protein [Calditrichaeota bacterium]|nr:MAG: extracellular solute-binding protein [Calditrichota bacterium]